MKIIMTLLEQIITVIVMGVAVMLTRFLPFAFFQGRKTPRYIQYLGTVLPAAVFGLLVIYCLKNVNITGGSHGIPEFIGIVVTVGVHIWKRQMLWSITAGTVSYMFLVQTIFA
jgi:branched-subunit amino acid transport protein AzlD